jgi:hypothetical protein
MLEHLDQQLLLYINSINSPFWDQVMYVISGRVTWIPLYIAILIALGIRYKRKFFVLVVMIIIAITLSDQISVMFKNGFQRLRPCHEPREWKMRGYIRVRLITCLKCFYCCSPESFVNKEKMGDIQFDCLGYGGRLQQNISWRSLPGRCYLRLITGHCNWLVCL